MAFLLPILFFVSAVDAAAFPAPVGHVNDFAEMLSVQTRAGLEQKLSSLQQETGIEIAVATVQNLGGDTVENVAVELFKQWGIGKRGKDNGVLLLISREDRKSRIEVGYGLEGVLTDVGTSRIQREILVPAFQKGEFDRGVIETIGAIEKAVRGDASINIPTGSSPRPRSLRGSVDPVAIFYGLVIAASWLASVLARSKSWWAGGVIGAGLGFALGAFLLTAITGVFAAVVFGALGTLFDFFVSRDYERRKAKGIAPHWWAGGRGWHGGGWGSGGFGGFGGGRSGGGGSSARW